MPITNLAIQRKRLLELRNFKKKYETNIEEIRITRPENYYYFYILANKVTPHHLHVLKEMKFDLCNIESENGKVKILVGKWGDEKHDPITGILSYLEWSEYIN